MEASPWLDKLLVSQKLCLFKFYVHIGKKKKKNLLADENWDVCDYCNLHMVLIIVIYI